MSGGTFDYKQWQINEIVEEIQSRIEKSGQPMDLATIDRWELEWYKEHPDQAYHTKYSEDILDKFKEGVMALKKAQIYAQRIDYLLAGDDGDDNFLRRLKEELNQLENEN
jgi:hypothetical protein